MSVYDYEAEDTYYNTLLEQHLADEEYDDIGCEFDPLVTARGLFDERLLDL